MSLGGVLSLFLLSELWGVIYMLTHMCVCLCVKCTENGKLPNK